MPEIMPITIAAAEYTQMMQGLLEMPAKHAIPFIRYFEQKQDMAQRQSAQDEAAARLTTDQQAAAQLDMRRKPPLGGVTKQAERDAAKMEQARQAAAGEAPAA